MLESLGYHTDTAESGMEALEKLNPEIDLILLDVLMPEMNGFEVCRRIRAHAEFHDIPVLMTTVLSDKEDRLEAVKAGANDFISKPIDKLELSVRVSSLIRMKEASDKIKLHTQILERAVEERTEELEQSQTECRQLYAESRRREEIYSSFVNASADAVVIYDLKGRVQHLSPSFTRVFGWTLEEVKGKRVPYFPEDSVDNSFSKMELVAKTGVPLRGLETRRLCKDGRVLDVTLSSSRYNDHENKPAGLVIVLHDISERKKIERALHLSEELFRTVFQQAQDGIFVKDRQLRYTLANPSMLRELHLTAENVLGQTDQELFGPDYAESVRDQELRVLNGNVVESEHSLTFKDRTRIYSILRSPMKGADEEIVGLCGVVRDITDRRRFMRMKASVSEDYVSMRMREVLTQVLRVAITNSTVLLLGESGCGKDYLARYLHDRSPRSKGPFFNVNCASLTRELAESELFGHEPGAFTGARGRKRGLLELAEGGTLLLNEVGELAPYLQAKLLTFLDSNSFTRVGGEKLITVDVRLLAATNRNLEEAVGKGDFRKDLYYRLNVFVIHVPALRERLEDLPLLTNGLLETLTGKLGLPKQPEVSSDAMKAMLKYRWPGNVRELRNILERALILGRGNTITADHLLFGNEMTAPGVPSGNADTIDELTTSLPEFLNETKKKLIIAALNRSAGNVTQAAQLLGITRESIKHHIRQLRLSGWKATGNG
jgi:PAS domain S-box-containing protein